MHNNPALLLFQIATLKGFPFGWATGEDKLFLVSVGTGYWGIRGNERGMFRGGIGWAKKIIHMLMEDASWHNQQILQYLSSSPTAAPIDSEIGILEYDLLGKEPHLSYLRYDVPLEKKELKLLNLEKMPIDVEKTRDLDRAENMEYLDRLGRVASGRLIHALHFPRVFDRA